MSTRLTPEEFSREARRLLPHLTPTRVIAAAEGGGYALFDARNFRRRSALDLSAGVLDAFVRAELVERRPKAAGDRKPTHYVLSEIGAAFLVRSVSGEAPFAAQHRALASGASNIVPFARTHRQGQPLAWLRTRKGADGAPFLTAAEVAAGERLREAYTGALLSPRPSAYWPGERVDASRRLDYSPTELCDVAQAARARFWSAVDAVGPGLAPVLVAIVCHLKSLETVEAGLKLPARSAKSLLKAALHSLAYHYGLISRGDMRAALRATCTSELPQE
jgi:hypothetical protein